MIARRVYRGCMFRTCLGLFGLAIGCALAQPAGANYDEGKVPGYTLPDPLVFNDGSPVKTPSQWKEKRRAELLRLFEQHVYGRAPGRPPGESFELTSVDRQALG